MIKSILKLLVISAIVLLVVQVSIGSDTIAGHFHEQVKSLLRWSGSKIGNNALVARLTPQPKLREDDDDREVEERAGDNEGVTTSDRENLMRLLQ